MKGIFDGPLARIMQLESQGEGTGIVHLTVDPERHTTTTGHLHSAMYAIMCEMAAGDLDPRDHVAQNISVTCMRPVKAGDLVVATAKMLKAGRTLITAETELHVGGKLIGKGTVTYAVIPS